MTKKKSIKEENKTKELKDNLIELKKTRKALINMLEDFEIARKRAEEEKVKTQTIIENFVDGILVFDSKNNLSIINPQAETFFNVRNKEVLKKSLKDLSVFPVFEIFINVIDNKTKGLFKKEVKINEELTLEVSTVPILIGEEIGTLIILHDVTREKMIEKMKTEFVSIAAHQLRTPLSAIKWTLIMLLDGDVGELNKDQKEFLKKTYTSNERMIELTNDLLNVTKIEEGRYLYNLQYTDISKEIEGVINLYKDSIKEREIKIIYKKPEKELPKIKVDLEKIKLVIQNLLDNSIKYAPAGGKVTIKIKKEMKNILFSIADTGMGISENQKNRIFTKFFRSKNAVRRETEGSGLGLFIAKNIVIAHGGSIWFKSKEGIGSTFFFSLPIEKEEKEK